MRQVYIDECSPLSISLPLRVIYLPPALLCTHQTPELPVTALFTRIWSLSMISLT